MVIFGDFHVFFYLEKNVTIIGKFLQLFLYNKSFNLSPSRLLCHEK